MIRYASSTRAFAVCLSILAGFVDAIGFMALGGFFVSFMSGNSTRLGVGLAAGSPDALVAACLIAAFVTGVVLGSVTGRLANGHRPARILLLVSGLLTIGALLAIGGPRPYALAFVAMAMGAANNVFEREGEVSVGVTYMTGTLVKFGQRLAAALSGGGRLEWLPYLLLWMGLVTGAFLGAACYPRIGLQALWIAVAASLCLAWISIRLDLTSG